MSAMTNARDLVLAIIGKDVTKTATDTAGKNFDKLTDKVDKADRASRSFTSKLKDGLNGLEGPATAAGVAVAALSGYAVKSASDAEQSLGATQTVFGRFADEIIEKSEQAATAVGLSANQYREAANVIASLLSGKGFKDNQLKTVTESLIEKGADLAAVFGGTAAEAVEALSSGLKGEFDPLERYGVTLSQDAINLKALGEAGGLTVQQFNKLTPAMQANYKAQAALNLIGAQTEKVEGQFAEQIGSTAERAQIARAQFDNLSATFGQELLPAVNKVLDVGVKVVDWLGKNKPVAYALAAGISVLAATVWVMNAAFLASPVTWIVLGIVALTAGIVYLATRTRFFQTIWESVWGFLKTIGNWFAGPFVDFFKDAFTFIMRVFRAIYIDPWVAAWNGIVAAAGAVARFFVDVVWHRGLEPVLGFIWAGIQYGNNIIMSFFNLWLWGEKQILRPFGAAAMWLWGNAIQPAITGIADGATWLWGSVLTPAFNGVTAGVRAVGDGATWLWQKAFRPAITGIGDGATWLWRNAIDPAVTGIGDAFTWLQRNIVQPIFSGMINGVHAIGDAFKTVFGAVTGVVRSAFTTTQSIVVSAINALIDKINGAIGLINRNVIDNANKIPGVNFPHFGTIPKLHSGGTFHAPPGMTEGLALLQEGERVVPASESRGGVGYGNVYVTIDASTATSMRDVAELLDWVDNLRNNSRGGLVTA